MSNRGATILSRTIVSLIDFSNSPRRISPIEANRENRGYLMGVQAHVYIRICIYILHIRTRTRNTMSFRQRVYMWQSEEHIKRKQVNCIGNFCSETLTINRVLQLVTGIWNLVHRSNEKLYSFFLNFSFSNYKIFHISSNIKILLHFLQFPT